MSRDGNLPLPIRKKLQNIKRGFKILNSGKWHVPTANLPRIRGYNAINYSINIKHKSLELWNYQP
jgi:hypothetical protein